MQNLKIKNKKNNVKSMTKSKGQKSTIIYLDLRFGILFDI